MSENLSALLDQEIAADDLTELVESLCQDPGLQERWQRYHLIRSAIRGECTLDYYNAVYSTTKIPDQLVARSSSEDKSQRTMPKSLSARLRRGWGSWPRGLGLAAGLTAALALGFASSSILELQIHDTEPTYVENAKRSTALNWWQNDSEPIHAERDSTNHLNETLLAHSEDTGYPLLNGLSNYIRMVAYDY